MIRHTVRLEGENAQGERVPLPRLISVDELKPRIAPKPGTSGMDKVFGHWPGDETTEQIEQALSKIG